jgi:hypothetical protein
MIGDYQMFFTPAFIQTLVQVNRARNEGGPFVLAVQRDEPREVEVCELQSESRVIVNARFERKLGGSEWKQLS